MRALEVSLQESGYMVSELHSCPMFALPRMEHQLSESRGKCVCTYRSNEVLIYHISLDLLDRSLESWYRLLGWRDDVSSDRLRDIVKERDLEHRIDSGIALPCLDTEEVCDIGDERQM